MEDGPIGQMSILFTEESQYHCGNIYPALALCAINTRENCIFFVCLKTLKVRHHLHRIQYDLIREYFVRIIVEKKLHKQKTLITLSLYFVVMMAEIVVYNCIEEIPLEI
jgi:hypothetical protein